MQKFEQYPLIFSACSKKMVCLRYMALCLLPLLVVPASLASSLCRTDPNRIKFFAALVLSSVFLFFSVFSFFFLLVGCVCWALPCSVSGFSIRYESWSASSPLLSQRSFFLFFFWAFDLIFLINFFFVLRCCQGYSRSPRSGR